MVVFTCQKCNSTLKKNAVEKHNSCRPFYLTCIDCLKDFKGREYDEHKSCISEMQKYGGSNVVVKTPGVKQGKWMDSALEILTKISTNNRYKNICLAIESSPNIPRNRKKFHNFIRSAHPRLYKNDIVDEIFDHLEEAKSKNGTEEEKQSITLDSSNEVKEITTENETILNVNESITQDTKVKKKKKKNKDNVLNETNNDDNAKEAGCEENETILNVDESITQDTKVKKKKKKNKDNGLNETNNDDNAKETGSEDKLENGTMETENGIESKDNSIEQKSVHSQKNMQNISKDKKIMRKNAKHLYGGIKVEDVFPIKKNGENGINKENNQDIGENEQSVKSNNEKLNTDNVDISKLSKKQLKKLKKQQKYNAEIAEIENYQPEKENLEITEEEIPRKKKKKHHNKEENTAEIISSGAAKRKLSEGDEVCADEIIEDKKMKLNDTLVEEEEVQSETRKKFKWSKVIKSVLENSSEKGMSLKKLRKKVISEYTVNNGEDVPYEKLLGIFNKKVNSTLGIKVLKDRAQLIED